MFMHSHFTLDRRREGRGHKFKNPQMCNIVGFSLVKDTFHF